MTRYQNSGSYLAQWMEAHPRRETIDPIIMNTRRPRGWDRRKLFGIEMLPWPTLSVAMDFEPQVKTSRGVPRAYLKCFLDDMDPKNVQQAQVMQAMYVMSMIPDSPLYFLIVCGGNGTGKTYMGAGLVNTLTRVSSAIDENGNQDDFNPMYVNEADLLSRITGFSSGRDWFWEYTENVKVLVVDEFGMSQWTPTDKKRMEQLLFKRHGNRLRTVLLTNRSQGEIREMVSPTIASRFEEKGRLFNLPGGDLRESLRESGVDRFWNEPYDDPF